MNLRLRRYSRADLDRLAALVTNPRVMEKIGGALRQDEAAGLLDRYLREDDIEVLAARAAELDGRFVGSGIVRRWETDAAEIGFLVGVEHRGRGVGTAIASALIELARTELGAERVVATVDSDHYASIRVLEKAGLARAETRRDAQGEFFVYATRASEHGA